ncbi:hypothetical protein OIDMADRAFT_18382, partial [Oidiodendron maius Zn]
LPLSPDTWASVEDPPNTECRQVTVSLEPHGPMALIGKEVECNAFQYTQSTELKPVKANSGFMGTSLSEICRLDD